MMSRVLRGGKEIQSGLLGSNMNANKDYYAILGVLPFAEDLVIRAAYKALATRYHPDRNDSEQATVYMQEINEAYSILSDSKKRQEYDELRGNKPQASESYFSQDNDLGDQDGDPLYIDWKEVIEVYPELYEFGANLDKIAFRLGYAYRAFLLETKDFGRGAVIANEMESIFLETYFGTDPDIVNLAKHLIDIGSKAAAKSLNEQIRIFGPTPDRRAVAGIVSKLGERFEIRNIGPEYQQYVAEEIRLLEALKTYTGEPYSMKTQPLSWKSPLSRSDSLYRDLQHKVMYPFWDDPLSDIYRLLGAGANPSRVLTYNGTSFQDTLHSPKHEAILRTLLTAERLWKKRLLSENGLTETNHLA